MQKWYKSVSNEGGRGKEWVGEQVNYHDDGQVVVANVVLCLNLVSSDYPYSTCSHLPGAIDVARNNESRDRGLRHIRH